MILAKVNIQYKLSDIKRCGDLDTEDKSLYGIVDKLILNKALVIIDDSIAYLDELRADYKNKSLYIPIFKCDIIEHDGNTLEYNNRIETVEIHNQEDGFKLRELWVIPNLMIPNAYKIDLTNIKLSRSLNEEDMQAKDIFNRYISQAYGYNDEVDVFDYTQVKKKYTKRNKLSALRDLGLEFYGKYEDIDYRDVRNWNLVELQDKFTGEELKLGVPYNIRRLQFELELYTRIADKAYWDNWSFGAIQNLIEGRHEYIKYKENGVYIIFKSRWLK